jgi:hypothetical protein
MRELCVRALQLFIRFFKHLSVNLPQINEWAKLVLTIGLIYKLFK